MSGDNRVAVGNSRDKKVSGSSSRQRQGEEVSGREKEIKSNWQCLSNASNKIQPNGVFKVICSGKFGDSLFNFDQQLK
jgi:hypothetical protein